MAALCLREEELLCKKKWKAFQFCIIRVKGFKEKYTVKNAWEKVGESLDFAENVNIIRASSN